MGKDYKVKVVRAVDRKVYLNNNDIVFQLNPLDECEDFIKLFAKWYQNLSEKVIFAQCNLVQKKISETGIPIAQIKIRSMKARWGSCYYNKNLIILNRHLVQLPKELINHVILHEYAHFIYHNHGKEFKCFLREIEQDSDSLEKIIRHKRHDELDFKKVFLRKDDSQ